MNLSNELKSLVGEAHASLQEIEEALAARKGKNYADCCSLVAQTMGSARMNNAITKDHKLGAIVQSGNENMLVCMITLATKAVGVDPESADFATFQDQFIGDIKLFLNRIEQSEQRVASIIRSKMP